MNLMPQLYDQENFSQPLNYHHRLDPYALGSLPFRTQQSRSLVSDVIKEDNANTRLSCKECHSRPSSSTSVDIPLCDVQLGPSRTISLSRLSRNTHSFNVTTEQNQIQSETLECLLSREKEDPPLPGASLYLTVPCAEVLPPDHECQQEGCQRVTINVSGLRFETQLRTLDRLPHTLLGNPKRRQMYWDAFRQEYFFDRHRPTFQAVLYYYQSGGRLKRPLEVPMDIFLNELQFYDLGASAINAFKRNEGYILETEPQVEPNNETMRKIWKMLEYPESSTQAKVVAILSICFIIISVVTFCVETLPAFKDAGCSSTPWVDVDGRNVTLREPDLLDPLFLVESCCITWFVMELGFRFVSCPSKALFLRSFSNWVDILAIAPYFVLLSINFARDTCQSSSKGSLLSVLRVLRVVRILKLSKHSDGLKILGMTLKTSIRELSMFVLFLAIATVIFSGTMFYAELDVPESQFSSIPDAFWWAIVTMTTVGYGDFVPVGFLGKILGGLCVLSGVLAIALPVPVVVANFNNHYRYYAGMLSFTISGYMRFMLCKYIIMPICMQVYYRLQ